MDKDKEEPKYCDRCNSKNVELTEYNKEYLCKYCANSFPTVQDIGKTLCSLFNVLEKAIKEKIDGQI